jgi:hypothetical protein
MRQSDQKFRSRLSKALAVALGKCVVKLDSNIFAAALAMH